MSEKTIESGRGWQMPLFAILLCGSLIVALSFGVRSAFGLFMVPISGELGWGREIFALSIALQNLLWGLGQPFAGALADRFGPMKVVIGGGLLYSAGVLIMSVSTTPMLFHLSTGVLVGFGLSGTGFSIVLAAVGKVVAPEKRSWALGIVTAAGSFGQFAMVPLGQAFLSAYGWQTTVLILGISSLAMLPLAGAFWGIGQRGGLSAGPASTQSLGEALREASRHRGFLLLTAGFFVCGFHVAFIAAHLPSFVIDRGLDPRIGAWALGLVGLFNVIGSYTSGVLGGKYSKKYLLSMLYVTRSAVIVLFISFPMTETTVLIFAAAMGLLWLSTVPLTSGIVAQVFGPKYMSMLTGIVFLSHQIGSFLGVWGGGYLYDTTGSYNVVWYCSIALGIFAGLVHWPIDERPLDRLSPAKA
ncbi:MFS transporter [Oceanibaculum indicum]|uniref:Monocarboxylate transporter n=2 Tax=Oceanibaculum indicum TaxID=526216 RepID=K2J647_9PROT|nr:MFS transporter [Oceanibaculum indicum]EKE70528.1 monocarboxylate transporter [Oceanibaculum indicum P24]RKQ73832.1 putative MFS family arabinose efflux permease [Oceanibaculum indicum]